MMCRRSLYVSSTVALADLNNLNLIDQTHVIQKRVNIKVGEFDEAEDILPFLQCLNKDPNLYVSVRCHYQCYDPED